MFHTAAVADIWGPWEHFYSINVTGHAEYPVHACQAAGVRKLVFTSSPSVTFDGHGSVRRGRESAVFPAVAVPLSAHESARGTSGFGRERSPRDADLACSGPDLIWGPRDGHLVPRLIDRCDVDDCGRWAMGRTWWIWSTSKMPRRPICRQPTHLEADSPVAGRAYFISQGEPVRCWEWIERRAGTGRFAAGAAEHVGRGGLACGQPAWKRSIACWGSRASRS